MLASDSKVNTPEFFFFLSYVRYFLSQSAQHHSPELHAGHLARRTQGTPQGDVHSQEPVTLDNPWSISKKQEEKSLLMTWTYANGM